MNIPPTLKPKSPGTAGADAINEQALQPDLDCCTTHKHQRCLILTQANGATEGFPLTWLYHWEWKQQGSHELLTITLTEHVATIRGKNLTRIIESLTQGTGFHLRVTNERYQSLLRPNQALITEITVQPHTKTQPQPHHENQS